MVRGIDPIANQRREFDEQLNNLVQNGNVDGAITFIRDTAMETPEIFFRPKDGQLMQQIQWIDLNDHDESPAHIELGANRDRILENGFRGLTSGAEQQTECLTRIQQIMNNALPRLPDNPNGEIKRRE